MTEGRFVTAAGLRGNHLASEFYPGTGPPSLGDQREIADGDIALASGGHH
jgi:hypothetical protein